MSQATTTKVNIASPTRFQRTSVRARRFDRRDDRIRDWALQDESDLWDASMSHPLDVEDC